MSSSAPPPQSPQSPTRLMKEAARCRLLAQSSSPPLAAELLREAERLEAMAAKLA